MCVDFHRRRPRIAHPRAHSAIRLIPALLGLGGDVAGAQPSPEGAHRDKGGYSLFHPVPADLMRPMALDRPDKTESPYTVDAGHYQLEMDLINYAWDRAPGESGSSSSGFAVAPMNWKAGLVNHVDFQIVIQPFNRIRSTDAVLNTPVVRSGFGEVTSRLKVNVCGDDGGAVALAVMPYITWPTAGEDLGAPAAQGGIILPFAADLPAGWGLGMMTEMDLQRSSNRDGISAGFVNTLTLGHDLWGPVAGYVEFFSETVTGSAGSWVGTLDFGVTWSLRGDWILDAGINVGLTRTAPDINPFAGVSHRF